MQSLGNLKVKPKGSRQVGGWIFGCMSCLWILKQNSSCQAWTTSCRGLVGLVDKVSGNLLHVGIPCRREEKSLPFHLILHLLDSLANLRLKP